MVSAKESREGCGLFGANSRGIRGCLVCILKPFFVFLEWRHVRYSREDELVTRVVVCRLVHLLLPRKRFVVVV